MMYTIVCIAQIYNELHSLCESVTGPKIGYPEEVSYTAFAIQAPGKEEEKE